jgi:hypothetical protein
MNNELWIKIGLIGADPQLGTLQGRVNIDESFSEQVSLDDKDCDVEALLDSCIHLNVPFKLFDPIIFRAQRNQAGDMLLGAAALTKSMPPVSTDYLTVNPSNLLWWAPIEESQEWNQLIASVISGLDLAGSGDLSIEMPDIPKGPRLVD